MRNQEKGLLVAPTLILVLFFLSVFPVQANQLYINELLDANPPHQVLKEGPIVRVEQPKVQDQAPQDKSIQPSPMLFRKVALTFDDGPDAIYTSRILDILKAEDVVATFFVLGTNVEHFPELTKRIFNEGHLIANHSRTHADFAHLTNQEIVTMELNPTSQVVERLTGFYPMIMRPPYGSLRDDSVSLLRELGWRIVRWSLDTFDWDSRRNSPDQIISRIQTQHHPNAIVLMHCNGPATTRVLPDVIKTLRELGYEFVVVTDL